ncbi:helix-turn-helix domain-containing protein [uncultured Bacteroides sp.]|uniref:helix-turn-helix domain-containing protein n=1 Tax=uncultured Bacteroides sp. TaxID=162156 RepID=UPI00259ADDD9|nr:helix-turn-helix domain-containing protein [uncultured Bacteroides sp.]
MEVITIEKKTFEEMTAKFDEFVHWVERICHQNDEKGIGEWLDNQEVCQLLNICPRTLQTLRDNGTLAYSQIHHKIYYKAGDVQCIVSVVGNKRKEAGFRNKTI